MKIFKTVIVLIFLVFSLFFSDTNAFAQGQDLEFVLCAQAGEELAPECLRCVTGASDITAIQSMSSEELQDTKGVWTAIGCIPTTQNGLAKTTIRLGLSLGGGFALLLILYGSVLTSISTGDPTRVKQGQDIIVAAISGIVFIILSIALFQFIGVQILQIPGLTS